jgi:D-alanyl-D-alanine dipeptidase
MPAIVRLTRTWSRRLPLLWPSALALLAGGCRTADLVEVKHVIPTVALDIRYATTNNFTGQPLYPHARCFLRREPARQLRAVQAELAPAGLGLKVYDGYRPLSVQRRMWQVFPDARYVADPAKGSRHNRGAAVDVTLISLADGVELPMPTAFDDFTARAHRSFLDLPPEVIRNRELLQSVMERHGFIGLPTEWWHFDYGDWRKYPLLDVAIPADPKVRRLRAPQP